MLSAICCHVVLWCPTIQKSVSQPRYYYVIKHALLCNKAFLFWLYGLFNWCASEKMRLSYCLHKNEILKREAWHRKLYFIIPQPVVHDNRPIFVVHHNLPMSFWYMHMLAKWFLDFKVISPIDKLKHTTQNHQMAQQDQHQFHLSGTTRPSSSTEK